MKNLSLVRYHVKELSIVNDIPQDKEAKISLENTFDISSKYNSKKHLWICSLSLFVNSTNPEAKFEVKIIVEGEYTSDAIIEKDEASKQAIETLYPYAHTGIGVITSFSYLPPLILPNLGPEDIAEVVEDIKLDK